MQPDTVNHASLGLVTMHGSSVEWIGMREGVETYWYHISFRNWWLRPLHCTVGVLP